MSLGSILKAIGNWLSKAFANIQQHAAPIAVAIVEGVKSLSDAGILTDLAAILPGAIPKEAVTLIQNALPKILADLLAIEGLSANATPEQIQTFVNSIIASFASKTFQAKSQLLTLLGVQVYNLIETEINKNPANAKLTFAQIVTIIENSYQDYVQDQAAATTTL